MMNSVGLIFHLRYLLGDSQHGAAEDAEDTYALFRSSRREQNLVPEAFLQVG